MAKVLCMNCRADLQVGAHELGCKSTRRGMTDAAYARLLTAVRNAPEVSA